MAGWLSLAGAIVAEILATTLLARSDGFARAGIGVLALAGYALAFYLLTRALRTVSLSVAYALWSGIGTAVVATIGVLFLGETLTPTKVLGLLAVVVGVVILELSGREPRSEGAAAP
ncbi:DMT family transporter [Georgenia thermotolerans]|uniref:EamA family transporter n=1 Tax=Georgenia thermotolerans TaxID=527326 RepID=A0A7J5US13_9MICO|nr:multidrug efflux SMR transporter [Georgenia thermotolerans]KAE8764934.1 EamA family transporter [Georgenia thermotolerans]